MDYSVHHSRDGGFGIHLRAGEHSWLVTATPFTRDLQVQLWRIAKRAARLIAADDLVIEAVGCWCDPLGTNAASVIAKARDVVHLMHPSSVS